MSLRARPAVAVLACCMAFGANARAQVNVVCSVCVDWCVGLCTAALGIAYNEQTLARNRASERARLLARWDDEARQTAR